MAVDFIKKPNEDQLKPGRYDFYKPGFENRKETIVQVKDLRSDLETIRKLEVEKKKENQDQAPSSLQEVLEGKPVDAKKGRK